MLGREPVASSLQEHNVLLATESSLQPLESVLFVFICVFNIFIMRDYLDITNGYFIEEKAFSTFIAAILNDFPRHACFNEQDSPTFSRSHQPQPLIPHFLTECPLVHGPLRTQTVSTHTHEL